ncbi:MAG TPA: hypothetical protein VNR39_11380 [Pseudolabrys sp.]|nr:hypothetical protein [Pseudolabrys sp.]
MLNVAQSFKVTHAVVTAAVLAGIFTVYTATSDRILVSAAATEQSAAKTCDGTWPYLNCGPASDQSVRVIRIN